jgi:hypothetical protein
MPTSLEKILAKNKLTRTKFMKAMGITYKNNENSLWYKKFAGECQLSQEEIDLVCRTIKELGLGDQVSVSVSKYLIV